MIDKKDPGVASHPAASLIFTSLDCSKEHLRYSG